MKTNTSQSNFSFRRLMVILVTLGFLIMPGLCITSALADEDLSGSVKISNNCLVFPNRTSEII